MLSFEFSNPKLAINKAPGVGYYITFSRMKYGCKKGLVWDLTNKHCDMSLHFEATCCHPSSKTTFSPQISKATRCMHLPLFVSRKIIKSRNQYVQGLNLNCQSQRGMVNYHIIPLFPYVNYFHLSAVVINSTFTYRCNDRRYKSLFLPF
jgi:hypothetical protein